MIKHLSVHFAEKNRRRERTEMKSSNGGTPQALCTIGR